MICKLHYLGMFVINQNPLQLFEGRFVTYVFTKSSSLDVYRTICQAWILYKCTLFYIYFIGFWCTRLRLTWILPSFTACLKLIRINININRCDFFSILSLSKYFSGWISCLGFPKLWGTGSKRKNNMKIYLSSLIWTCNLLHHKLAP